LQYVQHSTPSLTPSREVGRETGEYYERGKGIGGQETGETTRREKKREIKGMRWDGTGKGGRGWEGNGKGVRGTHTRLTALFPDYRVSRYQKGKTNLDFTEARDSEWQWHQLGHMQVCTSLLTDNHASTPPLSFLQARCRSCRPTNSVKALKAQKV